MDEEDIDPKVLNCKLTDEEKQTLSQRGYDMQRVLKEGSCSIVYLAEYRRSSNDEQEVHKNIKLKLACKVMETERAPKDFVQKYLLRELCILSQISHPHIIHTHSILHLNTKVLVFMRYAENGNLGEYINMYGVLREKQAKIWFRQLAVALNYLHSINIAHRDIMCENILLTRNNNVKLGDFGYSRFCADKKGKGVFSTTVCGSIAYAAPELIKGIPYDPTASDIWSLGIVLYIMLNGDMPFKTGIMWKQYDAQMNKDFRFRKSVLPRSSREVINLVSDMLEPRWFERPSIEEVLVSEWFGVEPSLLQFTPLEQEALNKVKYFKPVNKVKEIKKMIGRNRSKKIIDEISKEQIQEPSDEIDKLTNKLSMRHWAHMKDAGASTSQTVKKEVIPQQEKHTTSLDQPFASGTVVTEERPQQDGRGTSIDQSFTRKRASLDISCSGRRLSVDESVFEITTSIDNFSGILNQSNHF